jgi:hypothetical protein
VYQNLIEDGPKKCAYDIKEYNFIQWARQIFQHDNLKTIHEKYQSDFEVLTFETDQSTLFHKKWYDQDHQSEFYQCYNKFIKNEVRPFFEESIIYQKIPTFRTQVPNNLGVAEWHRDSDYAHDREEINIFLPLTEAHQGSTIWTETGEGKEDYTPLNAVPGEYYLWLGSIWKHGNQLNDTGQSRVSIDFRVMPLSQYKETSNVSTTYKMKMTIGEYFEVCE